jgi:hypothetical protein
MNTKIPRTLFSNAKIQILSIKNFLWISAVVLLVSQLQLDIPPASASAQLWTRGIDTNTLLAPSVVCPPSISFGETIQCSINSAGETDTYTFYASAGDKVLVRMNKSSGGLWSEIRVYSPDGTKLCEAYSSETAEIASCTLTSTGTYSILASDYFGTYTGDYYLYLQRLNNPGSPVPITFSQTLSGSIIAPAEMDTYTFTAGAGNKVLVRMSNSSGNLWPEIRIYSPDGTKLCEAYSSETAEIASCTLTSTGTYSILASDYFGTYTGDYSLNLACLTVPCGPPPGPTITEVLPNGGRNDIPNDINIYGTNFTNGATVTLGATSLSVTYVNSTHLRAVVPAGLPSATYDLTVTNPDEGEDTLANAYTVWDATIGIDDLFGFDHEFWTDPASPRANEPVGIGMVVHREGGQQVLSNVKVSFYLGAPQAGGTLLGDGVIPLLSPRSSSSTSAVSWIPPATGTYTLFAIIDPYNEVNESFENNNTVSRIVTVLPPSPDQIAPHVDSFTINDDTPTTTSQDVTLNTTASDPEPGTRVASVFYIEYEYSQAANVWIPAQWSGWLDYESSRVDYPWQLLPSVGVKYMQAWAADGAGNISISPYSDFICYQPISNTLWIGQSHIYRYTLEAGEILTAHIEPLSGDPDLYVWAPDYQTRPPWVSNLSSGPDEVSFTAPISGVYQVEVYGYTTSQYQITVEITAAGTVTTEQLNAGNLESAKPEPGQPVVPLESVPGTLIALPAPPVSSFPTVYLPLIVR